MEKSTRLCHCFAFHSYATREDSSSKSLPSLAPDSKPLILKPKRRGWRGSCFFNLSFLFVTTCWCSENRLILMDWIPPVPTKHQYSFAKIYLVKYLSHHRAPEFQNVVPDEVDGSTYFLFDPHVRLFNYHICFKGETKDWRGRKMLAVNIEDFGNFVSSKTDQHINSKMEHHPSTYPQNW